jgi:hypothetical protein
VYSFRTVLQESLFSPQHPSAPLTVPPHPFLHLYELPTSFYLPHPTNGNAAIFSRYT